MSHPFSYSIKINPRSRHLSIRITREGEVVVTKPVRISTALAETFVAKKANWIISKIHYMRSLPPAPKKLTQVEIKILKEKALTIVRARVDFFNKFYKFNFKNISIKNQKTRWGSCSSKGNLNFNCRIALLAAPLADYIVVHELCHLGQMNHSKKFWDLVAQTVPDHKQHHVTLRRGGLQLS